MRYVVAARQRVFNQFLKRFDNVRLLSSYGLKGPVYLKDKTGQVVTPHVKDDSVVLGPGRYVSEPQKFVSRSSTGIAGCNVIKKKWSGFPLFLNITILVLQ